MVLAYSGGLDTSVILKWLQETYDCEVVTFTADLGQVNSLLKLWLLNKKSASALCCGANCHAAQSFMTIQWNA